MERVTRQPSIPTKSLPAGACASLFGRMLVAPATTAFRAVGVETASVNALWGRTAKFAAAMGFALTVVVATGHAIVHTVFGARRATRSALEARSCRVAATVVVGERTASAFATVMQSVVTGLVPLVTFAIRHGSPPAALLHVPPTDGTHHWFATTGELATKVSAPTALQIPNLAMSPAAFVDKLVNWVLGAPTRVPPALQVQTATCSAPERLLMATARVADTAFVAAAPQRVAVPQGTVGKNANSRAFGLSTEHFALDTACVTWSLALGANAFPAGERRIAKLHARRPAPLCAAATELAEQKMPSAPVTSVSLARPAISNVEEATPDLATYTGSATRTQARALVTALQSSVFGVETPARAAFTGTPV